MSTSLGAALNTYVDRGHIAATATLVLYMLSLRMRRRPTKKPTSEELTAMLQRVQLLRALGEPEIAAAVESLEEQSYQAGEVICREDLPGDDCFFVVSGECVGTKEEHTLAEGTRVRHARHGEGTVTKVTKKPDVTRVDFDKGEFHRYTPPSMHKLKPVEAVEPRVVEVLRCGPGGHFGERALVRPKRAASRESETRGVTVTCKRDATVLRFTAATFLRLKEEQDRKENLLRGVPLFETFSDDQIAKLASAMVPEACVNRAMLVRQGEEGAAFFLLDAGECVATTRGPDGVDREVARYTPGSLFGEAALLESTVRDATVTACGEGVRVWVVSRGAFEARLGPLSELRAEQYKTDPRYLIADFYHKGDASGPLGAIKGGGATTGPSTAHSQGGANAAAGATARPSSAPSSSAPASSAPSSWFAVYRPCSRDSISKMVNRVGTGKGLNIKGKSAKKNRLSGFVPFCQISDNAHKTMLEPTPSDARLRIFYQSARCCAAAREAFEATLVELQVEQGRKLPIDEQEVRPVRDYEPDVYGLDVPELLLLEVYIMQSNLAPAIGWETGRGSEPAFLDMNRHALRDGGKPPVVLFQFDEHFPFNPSGLLMAYAETSVKPVVSDFDTFLIGSRGVTYQPTPPEQIELMNWALTHTESFLAKPNGQGWMSRWLDVLKDEADKGFHPTLPEYGFGDPTSYGLIGDVVNATGSCGAVRHGAECFNFYFPQKLDDQFLIVWDGLDSPPWRSVREPELRSFLLERAREGFSFPLNPVWPVRDVGWLAVLQALQQHDEASSNLRSWFPPESGVLRRIETIQAAYPNGFSLAGPSEIPRSELDVDAEAPQIAGA